MLDACTVQFNKYVPLKLKYLYQVQRTFKKTINKNFRISMIRSLFKLILYKDRTHLSEPDMEQPKRVNIASVRNNIQLSLT